MGNYYNFYAATAGSGTSTFIGEAPDFICPKGWRMVGNEGNGSFINLFADYYGGTKNGVDLSNGDTIVIANIFTFLRSGYYDFSNGIIYNNNNYSGNYWSMYTSSSNSAYFLELSPIWLGYQGSYRKGRGFPLRCVANANQP